MIKKLIASARIFKSFESRNYRFYFTGQSISLIGSWIQSIAMAWLVYRLTGSKFLLGLIGFTNQIPSFVLSPFTGVLTDRFSRRKMMLWAQVSFMIHALIMSALVLTNLVQIWHIIALSILFGIISAFDTPARQALVVDLIDDPKNLNNVIGLNSAMFNAARLFGPAIAGIAIALVGEGFCFLFNGFSYLAIIWALIKIKTTNPGKKATGNSWKIEFIEGFKYTFGLNPIRKLLALLAILSLIGTPFSTIMPAFAAETLKGGSHTYGFLMSATGAGALSAAIFLASRQSVIGLGKIIMMNTIVFGLALFGLSISVHLWFAMGIGFVSGFSMIATIASVNTLIQTLAEENKRGRVMSFYAMALMGVNPFGNLIAGSLANSTGLSFTLLLSGIITALTGIWFTISWPRSRKEVYPVLVQKGILDGNRGIINEKN
ncbi:MAG: MFS transporter [Bacteroidales bacterium]